MFFKRIAATAIAYLAISCVNAGAVWSGNGHEYMVVRSEGVTWTDARALAVQLGSDWTLATITSTAEQAFVASLLPTTPGDRDHYWIGAADADVEGIWPWITGEDFSFTSWWSWEPNGGRRENYLALDYRARHVGWGWNDAPDNLGAIYGMARGYVMERGSASQSQAATSRNRGPAPNDNQVPLPGTMSLAGLAAALLLAARRIIRPIASDTCA
jgi:hypothetical protein